MYVREFHASNFKAVIDAAIRPGEAGLFLIGGENEQGKSSLIDAVAYCLRGKATDIARPLRNGEDEATLAAELDGPEGPLSIERRLVRKADGAVAETVTVKNAQGFKVHSPAKLLESLTSALAFDFSVLANGRGKAADTERRELVIRAFGMGEELEALKRERKAAYMARRDTNRDLKVARARLSALGEVPTTLPARVDVSALVAARDAEVRAAAERRREVDAAQARAREAAQALSAGQRLEQSASVAKDAAARRVAELEAQLERARQEQAVADSAWIKAAKDGRILQGLAEEAADAALAAEAAWTPADTDFLDMDIEAARETNAEVDRLTALSRQVDAAQADVDRLSTDSNRQTAVMADLDARARRCAELVAAELPGTEIEADTVDPETGDVVRAGELLLGGVPFSEAAKSRRFRWAFQVCARSNPGLRLVACRDGEAFGDAALEELHELAVSQGYQFIVERVGEHDDGALIIEAGRVKEVG